MESYLKDLNINEFQRDLITWYDHVKRDLPWRIDQDPYRVLVSEIMLQQTQVVTVIPYYQRFMTLFPTPKALAQADEQTLLKAWEGLGYYSRARNLQESASMIDAMGGFPTSYEEILKLKGVGPYTAGAVASIAFSLPTPAVDGNVFRVISRICCIFEDIAKPKTRKLFESVVSQIISHEDPGAFNQGLMELGATVCRPKSPICLECPVQRHCQAYAQGIDDLLPVKSKAGKQIKEQFVVGIIQNQYKELLIQKRQNQGLLANFYEFPNFKYEGKLEPTDVLRESLNKEGFKVKKMNPLGLFTHVFSHRIWEMEGYLVEIQMDLSGEDQVGEGSELWIHLDEFQEYPLVAAHIKLLKSGKLLENIEVV